MCASRGDGGGIGGSYQEYDDDDDGVLVWIDNAFFRCISQWEIIKINERIRYRYQHYEVAVVGSPGESAVVDKINHNESFVKNFNETNIKLLKCDNRVYWKTA